VVEDHADRYYKDQKTARHFLVLGGTRYARTGDWARYTDDGSLCSWSRVCCINSGGEKIFPEEVEEIIKRHRGNCRCCSARYT